MKNTLSSVLSLTLVVLVMLSSACLKDNCDREVTYIKQEPIYKTYDEIRTAITTSPAQKMEHLGKIYYYNNYILINEIHKGIHVLDNSDPRNPVNVAFINIEGNIDMAVKNNVLYADNYTDLLAINISNPTNASLLSRVPDAFPHEGTGENNTLLVAYKGVQVTENVSCDWGSRMDNNTLLIADSANPAIAGAISSSAIERSLAVGISGSMAKFSIGDNTLYTIDNQNMYLFDISSPNAINATTTVNVGLGIETLYPYENYLFIGANNGMYIYDNSNVEAPTYISRFEHVTSCDPVVVEGNYAYVTLSGGLECGGWLNELQIIDISNVHTPTQVASYEMHNPRGLSIRDGMLYVCDNKAGLHVFDATNTPSLEKITQVHNMQTYDVIAVPNSDLLLVVGPNGFEQYDRSNPASLELLSRISAE